MLKKIPLHQGSETVNSEGHALRCEMMVNRWTHAPRWPQVYYYVDTGRKSYEQRWDGEFLKETYWNLNGSVRWQILSQVVEKEGVADTKKVKCSPPWLWGVRDQTEPTAPWWGKK